MGATGMRYHELALQKWLYGTFFVREGYPIPVVFSTPMDAFGNFLQLWKSDKNPFKYLTNLKDDNGTPLYEPYPSTLRYPLISVFRRRWTYRPEQSYGVHQFRHMNWPTVASNPSRCELGEVTTSFRPNAWDYKFQIDHFCMRPDTQAYFIEQLMRNFIGIGGGSPQTWMTIHFPAIGFQRIRMYLDGDIENSTPEEPEDGKHVEFRTTINLVIEGYSIDQNIKIVPALWNLILRSNGSASPDELQAAFDQQITLDLRLGDNNSVLNSRSNVPSDTACQKALASHGTYPAANVLQMGTSQPDAYAMFGFYSTNTSSPYFVGAVPQTSGFGIATVGSL